MDGDRVGELADAVRAARGARRGTPVLVGGGITSRPGIAAAVEADGLAHSLGEALRWRGAGRPA